MKYENVLKENGTFRVDGMDFAAGRWLTVRYAGVSGCARADVALNAPDNVVCSLSLIGYANFPERNEALVFLGAAEGKTSLWLIPRYGRFEITSAELSKESPVPDYVPVPEDRLVDMESALWSATDELGRRVRDAEDVRGYRPDRHVGIFYWTWRDGQSEGEPVNVSRAMERYPGAEYNAAHPIWGPDGSHISSWNEPLFGYYLNRDPYVIRRHAVLLSDAGVDMVVFDCTNGTLVWKEAYEPLLDGWRAAREDGIRTPQFAFLLNFAPFRETEEMLRALYADIYSVGRWRDLWYLLDGKPLILAYPEALPGTGSCPADTALLDEIRNFFTFRPGMPSYGHGPKQSRMWGWLEKYPQHKFGERPDGTCEMMTVGVAQNCSDEKLCTYFNNRGTYGRSYTHRYGHKLLDENSYKYGYNFEEQWERALDCDPEFIFITGWNEWIMGRWHDSDWIKDPDDNPQLAFVDQFDKEHSRDIEPDRDGIRDNFYLQMCSNIRRYKGARPRKLPSAPKTIRSFADFDEVTPVYRSERGTTVHRDCKGFGHTHYLNKTGRNNIIAAKVARDDEFLWFMAECAEEITPKQGMCHMTLYLNLDRSRETGWEGYNLAVSRGEPLTPFAKEGGVSVEWYEANRWIPQCEAEYRIEGNRICYRLPRSAFGAGPLDFEFKWVDNVDTADILNFYADGDTAPTGRFNYVFRETGFPKKMD